jgi:2-methylisocitrate lyase-like PEP mutase family enzyme
MTSFRDLHRRGDPFILANAWDAGSAKVLKSMGAQAIATSSAAHAFTLGRPDGLGVTRDEALAHAQDLIAATGLPVQGDFEIGWGDDLDTVAETVTLAGKAGLAGICIEDIKISNTGCDIGHERARVVTCAQFNAGHGAD